MQRLDGSQGELGGQVLRAALSLSAATGRAFRMTGILAGGSRPGLTADGLACLRAAAKVCDARVSGARAGSTEVSFRPGRLRTGKYAFRVRAPGSAVHLAQTLALPLIAGGGESGAILGGGTHLPGGATAGHLREVWARAMGALGARVEVQTARAGFGPKCGGEIRLSVGPRQHPLLPLDGRVRGALRGIRGEVVVSRLPETAAGACLARAEELLADSGLFAECMTARMPAASAGICLELTADFGLLSAGFQAVGQRGRPAEELADRVVSQLLAFLASGAAVGVLVADQLLLALVLAPGVSRFSVERIDPGLLGAARVAGELIPGAEVAVRGRPGEPGEVRVRGAG
jgi:RNA 3'-terminal phosphate cyclase (ATP)